MDSIKVESLMPCKFCEALREIGSPSNVMRGWLRGESPFTTAFKQLSQYYEAEEISDRITKTTIHTEFQEKKP